MTGIWQEDTDGIVRNKYHIYTVSHRSISSQSSSIAGDETVLFILVVTALQQTDQEENRDGGHRMKRLLQATADSAKKCGNFFLEKKPRKFGC